MNKYVVASLLFVVIIGTWLYQKNQYSCDIEFDGDREINHNLQSLDLMNPTSQKVKRLKRPCVDMESIVQADCYSVDVVTLEPVIVNVESVAEQMPVNKQTESYRAIVDMKKVDVDQAVTSSAAQNKMTASCQSSLNKIKQAEPVDLKEECIYMPNSSQLVDRLKKAGFGGLASNKRFIGKIAEQNLSTEQVNDLVNEELGTFKDKWIAIQRRGKLCNVLLQDYPKHVAYLKQCENIEDNPKIYWKTAKLYAKKLTTGS